MAYQKPREERVPIFLCARMRSADGWHDVTVCNVSSRGMMLSGAPAPARGAIIEIRYRRVCVIGRVVWSQGARYGVRTQDRVDLTALTAGASSGTRNSGEERRVAPRGSVRTLAAKSAEKADASRRFARAFEWSIVVAGVISGAVALSNVVSEAFNAPIPEIEQALSSARH